MSGLHVKKHELLFKVPPRNWGESFPIGNGALGANVYQPDGCWEWVVNHMDVITSAATLYQMDTRPENMWHSPVSLDEIKRRALDARGDPKNPGHQDYNIARGTSGYKETVHETLFAPVAGKLRVYIAGQGTRLVSSEQKLSLASGIVRIDERYETGSINCETFSSRDSKCIFIRITNDMKDPIAIAVEIESGKGYTSEVMNDAHYALIKGFPVEGFSYVIGAKLVNGDSRIECDGKKLVLHPGSSGEMILAVTVATSLDGDDPAEVAKSILEDACKKSYQAVKSAHEAGWTEFWSKSEMSIPDKFLEYLWYFNLYSLASTSGIGTKEKHGCGLYGLWYNGPVRWPNCWYEDVNIQVAYWPVYVSNHMEMSEIFVECVKARLPKARAQAEDWYGVKGASYGYHLMPCISPWYCQHLWWHYRYSMDESYLRETAYPVMKEVLEFFENYATYEEDGTLAIFPEISPEQGPLTKNSVQTISSLKYVLSAAIESTTILGIDKDKSRTWKSMLEAIADYATSDSRYGEIILDSEWAASDLYMAHPGLLMPIYPLHELKSDVAENTFRYATEMTATITFCFGWLASAAASLGRGDEALNLLYEKGIALMMLPAGYLAETTDRTVQACSVIFPSIYCPPLMEASGGLVAAVNEMLIQSRPDGIAVFPALPSEWKDVSFSGMLTEGAFEVSAERRGGQTSHIEVRSLAGGKCRLLNPWPDKDIEVRSGGNVKSISGAQSVIEIDTEKGSVYNIEASGVNIAASPESVDARRPLVYTRPDGRRIFLGRDEHSEFIEAIDRFLLPVSLGKYEVPKATKYKIDFGVTEIEKDFSAVAPHQFMLPNKHGSKIGRVGVDTLFESNYLQGFGWEETGSVVAIDRLEPDCLRRDFVTGNEEKNLLVFLAKGTYNALIVSGDAAEARGFTRITFPGGQVWETTGNPQDSGFEVDTLPFTVPREGNVAVTFSTVPGSSWKISALMINQV